MPNLHRSKTFENEHWMTAQEMQHFFKISRSTLYRWCQQKQLPYTVMGGTRYYPKHFTSQLMEHNLQNKEIMQVTGKK